MAEETVVGKSKSKEAANFIVSCIERSRAHFPGFIYSWIADYTLNNPDTLTKYKTAAQISHKVLEVVTGWCVEGEKVVSICERGDKLLGEEVSKVYKGKKIAKGQYCWGFTWTYGKLLG